MATMKLLILSDIHGATIFSDALIEKTNPDAIILSGDIPTAIDFPILAISLLRGGNRATYVKNLYSKYNERITYKQIRSAKRILTDLVKFGIPVVLIHGNTETLATRNWISLFVHRYPELHWISDSFVKIDDVLFVGHGWIHPDGSNHRVTTPGEVDVSTAQTILLDTFGRANQEAQEKILISHSPPYGTPIDFLPHKKIHAGSKPVRNILDSGYFDGVISGHLHEAFGFYEDKSKSWFALNAGAVIEDMAWTIDLATNETKVYHKIRAKTGIGPLIYRNRVKYNYDKVK